MNFVIVIAAFFFAMLMCVGLIVLKWIITQLGATVFLVVLFLVSAMVLLAAGEGDDDDK